MFVFVHFWSEICDAKDAGWSASTLVMGQIWWERKQEDF